jgi:Zn-dependent protease with chaperone function
MAVYLVSYVLYSSRKNDPARRSQLLQPMLVSSMFSWAFLGTSLLLCTVFLDQYVNYPNMTIREVFGGSILASLAFAAVMTSVARRHAFTKMLERMTSPLGLPSIASGFGLLSRRMGIVGVSLREASLGNAFSINLNGRGVVAISPQLTRSLSPDETEAVLAHELSHIRNGDSGAKGLARLARVAFPFDPALRLVEAAVHRERELWADRVAVEFTRKPLALASALVKANSHPPSETTTHTAGLFVGGSGRGLFSLYPNLERRVDALIELAKRMEAVTGSAVISPIR